MTTPKVENLTPVSNPAPSDGEAAKQLLRTFLAVFPEGVSEGQRLNGGEAEFLNGLHHMARELTQ